MDKDQEIISEKNTKNEILAAYRRLMERANQGASEEKNTQSAEGNEVVEKASQETVEKINNYFAQFKSSFNSMVGNLTEKMAAEAERLANLRKAVTLSQKELEENHKIKATAGLLYRMVELQKEEEVRFEKEIKQKRNVWEEEQKDYVDGLKRERVREEDEYKYQTNLVKKHDEESRTETRRLFDVEITKQREAWLIKDKELEELRQKVARFPTETEKSISEAVTRSLAEVKKDSEVKEKMAKQQSEMNLQLAQLKTDSLEEKVKEQEKEISRLKAGLDEATRQVKDLAVSVAGAEKRDRSQNPTNS